MRAPVSRAIGSTKSANRLREIQMARAVRLSSMSIEELLKLRDEVGRALSQKAVQLEQQLARLGGEVRTERRGRGGSDMLRARARYGVLRENEPRTVSVCRAHTHATPPTRAPRPLTRAGSVSPPMCRTGVGGAGLV